jgi:hypothetical protein
MKFESLRVLLLSPFLEEKGEIMGHGVPFLLPFTLPSPPPGGEDKGEGPGEEAPGAG